MTDSSLNSEATSPRTEEGEIMNEPTHIKNIFEPQAANPLASMLPYMGNMGGMGGAGAGAGAGLGAGLLGGILGGALLGNRGGLLGGGNGGDVGGVVTPALLASSLAQVTDSQQNTTVLQSLGDIKASIPLAEGQVQLALAVAQADINRTITGGQSAIIAGQSLINKNVSDAIASSLASQNSINVNVLTQGSATRESVMSFGTANLTATKDAQYATGMAIAASTKEIIAALTDQNTQTLQRQLSVAESALVEQRSVGRSREVEVNVTQSVNQNQVQLQMQQQQQQQAILLANIASALNGLQVATATNSQLIVGNSGRVDTGSQTANPVNVRT